MQVQFNTGQPPTDVIIRQDRNRRSTRRIQNLRNDGNGNLTADSFFDIFVEIELPQLNMILQNDQPMRAGMSFGTTTGDSSFGPPGDPLPAVDVPWVPTWIWREVLVNQDAPLWVQQSGAPWDRWVSIHGHVTPEPAGAASLLVAGGIALVARRRASR